MSSEELFVVHVQEQRTEALAGHEGGEYVSPPQKREHALQLVELVAGGPRVARHDRAGVSDYADL